eukprot:GHUV01041877.1.p1 GENE.GHUV01041877.1~~GHUV01041877.1.p1  ORF type:complete len:108 (+),score=3.18 GHUV01041877.1:636-959(+)
MPSRKPLKKSLVDAYIILGLTPLPSGALQNEQQPIMWIQQDAYHVTHSIAPTPRHCGTARIGPATRQKEPRTIVQNRVTQQNRASCLADVRPAARTGQAHLLLSRFR